MEDAEVTAGAGGEVSSLSNWSASIEYVDCLSCFIDHIIPYLKRDSVAVITKVFLLLFN